MSNYFIELMLDMQEFYETKDPRKQDNIERNLYMACITILFLLILIITSIYYLIIV